MTLKLSLFKIISVCVCIHVNVCACIWVYLCMYAHVCMCVCLSVHMCIYEWVFLYVVCLCAYPCMGVCVPVYMECMFVFMSACRGHVCMCQSCSSWFFPSIIWVSGIEFSLSLLSHLASSRTQILNPFALLLILNTELIQDDLFSLAWTQKRGMIVQNGVLSWTYKWQIICACTFWAQAEGMDSSCALNLQRVP